MADVSGEKAKQLVEAGALLLDVRSKEEYADDHLEGAVNIPIEELESRLAELAELAALEAPIVVHCLAGGRAYTAEAILEQEGYTQVFNLGGINDWPGRDV